jgi:hypothetical protein
MKAILCGNVSTNSTDCGRPSGTFRQIRRTADGRRERFDKFDSLRTTVGNVSTNSTACGRLSGTFRLFCCLRNWITIMHHLLVHITVLLSRFVAAVSACTRYCIRTLKYTVNNVSSLRDLSVIAGILWMRLRTKYTDGDCRLSITYPAQSRRDDTLLTVYFSIRTFIRKNPIAVGKNPTAIGKLPTAIGKLPTVVGKLQNMFGRLPNVLRKTNCYILIISHPLNEDVALKRSST